jgi:glycosyltransferase involved in cell wall biosynthesis
VVSFSVSCFLLSAFVMRSISVMQVVDSLQVGGLESVAVNLANRLSERGIRSSLCSTRTDGLLAKRLSNAVGHLSLHRRGLIDPAALRRLIRFIREHRVDIVHAHGSSLFFSGLAKLFVPRVKLIWHIHFGRLATEERTVWVYRLAAKRVSGVIAVNEQLAGWAKTRLKVPANRVWQVPNGMAEPINGHAVELPGVSGKRIVCVANLRPAKDHPTLVEAMTHVVRVEPQASLLLVGSEANQGQTQWVRELVERHRLGQHVFLLGSRNDVYSVLRACDIGVLSSVSEGMPLALLEYGMAGLPTVATRVGQVPEMLDQGQAGVLVAARQPTELSQALVELLGSRQRQERLGQALQQRVRTRYGEEAFVDRVVGIYETVLGRAEGKMEDGR